MLSIKPYPQPVSKTKITKKLAKELHVPIKEIELQEITYRDVAGTTVWQEYDLDELEHDCV